MIYVPLDSSVDGSGIVVNKASGRVIAGVLRGLCASQLVVLITAGVAYGRVNESGFMGTLIFMGSGSPSECSADTMIADKSGNYIVAGTITMKKRWTAQIRKYDPSLTRLISAVSCGEWESVSSVILTESGDIVVSGKALQSRRGAGSSEYWIIRKYDGALKRLISSTSFVSPAVKQVDVHGEVCIAVDSLGRVIVGGTERTAAGDTRWRILIYSPDLGRILSGTTYQVANGTYCELGGLVVDTKDNIIVAGEEAPNADSAKTRMVIRRYSPMLLRLESATVYADTEGYERIDAFRIKVDPLGNIYAIGSIWRHVYGLSTYGWTVRRYDPELKTLISSTAYYGEGQDEGPIGTTCDMSVTRDSVYILGNKRANGWTLWEMDLSLKTVVSVVNRCEERRRSISAAAITVDHLGRVCVVGNDMGGPGNKERWRVWKYEMK